MRTFISDFFIGFAAAAMIALLFAGIIMAVSTL